ncbi:MAG: hypothetical protein KH297_07995 [Firmicutes bacterium]|nr:hypothetical protein [Bacillota bacterium]
MTLGEIGAVSIFLLVIFIFGRIWFQLTESLLDKIKGLFSRRKEKPAWHTLPEEKDGKESH